MIPKRDWVDQAACLGMDSDIFFPEQSFMKHVIQRKVEAAKQVCATCPVTEECLKDALVVSRSDDVAGVRAGLTKDERDEYRKTHGKYRCKGCDLVASAGAMTRHHGSTGHTGRTLVRDPQWRPPRTRGHSPEARAEKLPTPPEYDIVDDLDTRLSEVL